jgi:SagB-type dehydrogenase family enzyme
MPTDEPVAEPAADQLVVAESIAAEYHVASRNQAAHKRMYTAYDVHLQPAIRDLVTDAPLHVDGTRRVPLPTDDAPVSGTVLDVIRRRASGRNFSADPLPAATLATLLRHANGVLATAESPNGSFYRRAAANSGDLGSVEVYPIVLNVQGVEPGIYHFDSLRHDLAELRSGQFADWLREVVIYQVEFSRAAAALVLTSAVGRLQTKYSLRGYRFGLLDVGHVSQNLYLVATALGLQVCATAGFIDDVVDSALGLDGLDVASMLVVLVGL